ncbi:MAG: T9SS type A sorting domain-containing protein [Chitinophagaceae bacterium]
MALALMGCFATAFAQTVPVYPSGTTTKPVLIPENNSVTFSIDPLSFGYCALNLNYSWTVTNASGQMVFTSTSASPQFYFDNVGRYIVTVKATSVPGAYCGAAITRYGVTVIDVDTEKKVPKPNMFSANSLGTVISAYSMDKSGNITSGPYDHFDPFPSNNAYTAALAMDDKGNYFYLPTFVTGNYPFSSTVQNKYGVVEVWAVDKKANNAPVVIASFDLNGASTAELGLFRLGLDDKGNAWILAGDGTNLYVASFKTDGTKPVKTTDINYRPIAIENGSAADFESGDLTFDNKGNMYVLAGSSTGTHIYTMASGSTATAPKLSKKWTVTTLSGGRFSMPVTGTVFDADGSMYFSAIDGIYYIDQQAVSVSTATAMVKKTSSGFGLMDMATSQFPAAWTPPVEVVVLPMQLKQFSGSQQSKKIELSWMVAQNETGSYFEIEKSDNGTSFTTHSLLFASEKQGDETYRYSVAAPLSDKVFYRLKMVNKDQTFSFSNVIFFGSQPAGNMQLSLLQNPVSGTIHFSYNSAMAQQAEVSVYNMNGRKVQGIQQNMQQGHNQLSLPATQLPTGLYILEVVHNGSRQTAKFYKK